MESAQVCVAMFQIFAGESLLKKLKYIKFKFKFKFKYFFLITRALRVSWILINQLLV